MCVQKTSEFEDQLSFVRNRLMGPLSAASMEMGSYQRGYDYIVRCVNNIFYIFKLCSSVYFIL